jgi:FtsP/CotA-like multicopper oxidase with cupredoxin domain
MNSFNLPNSDRLFGVAAFLISMGMFFVYIYEARLFQKQQYASALPYLEMWNSGGGSSYRLLLVNNGVGPAFVRKMGVHYRGKVYNMDHVAFYNKVRNHADTLHIVIPTSTRAA